MKLHLPQTLLMAVSCVGTALIAAEETVLENSTVDIITNQTSNVVGVDRLTAVTNKLTVNVGSDDVSGVTVGRVYGEYRMTYEAQQDIYSYGIESIEINLKNEASADQIRGGCTISNDGYVSDLLGWAEQYARVGAITVNVDNSTVRNAEDSIRAAGGACSVVSGQVAVNVTNGSTIAGNIYAGARGAGAVGSTLINIKDSTVGGDIYGGGFLDDTYNQGTTVKGDVSINISGANTSVKNVYAAGENSHVEGDVNVSIDGNAKVGTIYSAAANSTIGGKSTLTFTSYTGDAVSVDGFDEVVIGSGSSAKLGELVNVDKITVESGASLSLGDIVLVDPVADGSGYAELVIAPSSSQAIDFSSGCNFIITLSDDLLSQGARLVKFNLLSVEFSNSFDQLQWALGLGTGALEKISYAFVNERGELLSFDDSKAEVLIGSEAVTFTVAATIPEPSTATLSLLALSAMVGRRRRR